MFVGVAPSFVGFVRRISIVMEHPCDIRKQDLAHHAMLGLITATHCLEEQKYNPELRNTITTTFPRLSRISPTAGLMGSLGAKK